MEKKNQLCALFESGIEGLIVEFSNKFYHLALTIKRIKKVFIFLLDHVELCDYFFELFTTLVIWAEQMNFWKLRNTNTPFDTMISESWKTITYHTHFALCTSDLVDFYWTQVLIHLNFLVESITYSRIALWKRSITYETSLLRSF